MGGGGRGGGGGKRVGVFSGIPAQTEPCLPREPHRKSKHPHSYFLATWLLQKVVGNPANLSATREVPRNAELSLKAQKLQRYLGTGLNTFLKLVSDELGIFSRVIVLWCKRILNAVPDE